MADHLRRNSGKRKPIHGNDPWRTFGSETLCHWDLWMLILIVARHGGDWDSFREQLREQRKCMSSSTRDVEAKLSHLDQLRERLQESNLAPLELVGELASDRMAMRKAKTKILDQQVVGSQMSASMQATPRKRLYARALCGNWAKFPRSPISFARTFRRLVKRGFYPKSATFAVADRLESTLEKETGRCGEDTTELVALHRAFLTTVVEAMERVDDSYGVVGETYPGPLRKYFSLPWIATGIPPEAYLRDILEFITWEDYGLTRRADVMPFFEGLEPEHASLADAILRETRAELVHCDLEYGADTALTWLGLLTLGQEHFDELPELAKEMGSRVWERITVMAEAAWNAGRFDVADAIFVAADQPGSHREYLRERHQQFARKSRRPSESGPDRRR